MMVAAVREPSVVRSMMRLVLLARSALASGLRAFAERHWKGKGANSTGSSDKQYLEWVNFDKQ